MGTDAHVVLTSAAEALLHTTRARLGALEARWSRFLPDSELSRLNQSPGELVLLSDVTYDLIELAVAAWRLTAGRFDPTVLDALCDLGYDRSFDDLATVVADPGTTSRPAAGCAAIELYPELRAVVLPPGVRLDLGGIGKGHAADLVCGELRERGAAGACVSLGGDVRVSGRPPAGDDAWTVDVEHPFTNEPIARVRLDDGAVATSSAVRRRWRRGNTTVHHLIDPATGAPAPRYAAVTVVAGSATLAEILTKGVFVADMGDGAALLADNAATGLVVDHDGQVVMFDGFGDYAG
jgi:thiamine biosynthesis lipoprotein